MKIWDYPTRIIHWVIAACVVLNFFILEEGDPPHTWAGYTALFFVGLRIIWGIWGSTHSRFRSFPLKVSHFLDFLKNKSFPGHNPVASVVYLFVWICVIGLGISGYMMGLDRFFGEEWLEELHETIGIVLKILVVLHFIGMILDSWKFKRKTWLGMIKGYRE